MEIFVLVSFWLYVIAFILISIMAGTSKYPRKQEFSLGFDLSRTLLRLPFIMWAAYLLWGN